VKILIYSLNTDPELTGIGKYSGGMATWLANQGHQVRTIAAPPYYPEWQVHQGHSNGYSTEQTGNHTILRAPLYVPAQPTTLKRILHLASFALCSCVPLLRCWRWRPDVIVVVEPTLFIAPAALLFASLVGARTVLHVQDFEVDAMLGLGMASTGLVGKFASAIDRFLMRRFDRVSAISGSMRNRACNKGVEASNTWDFPNWADEFAKPTPESIEQFRADWGLTADTRLVLYSGNLGRKQGLEIILEAAQRFRDNPLVHFAIVGDGAHGVELRPQAATRKLDNLSFHPLQPLALLPAMLGSAAVHLVPQLRGAADLVLPSKLTNILAIGGHALVTADASTELGRLARERPGIFQVVPPEDVAAFIGALEHMLSAENSPINLEALRYAEESLSRENILADFEQKLASLVP
jgi:colanic acid biosynthesis glycosyl transferase WcaI